MNKILFTPHLKAKGSKMADLQDALSLMLDRKLLLKNNMAAREEMHRALARERAKLTQGPATTRSIALFQQSAKLPATGKVDERTAEALNKVLEQLGVLEQEGKTNDRRLSGSVRYSSGIVAANRTVRAYDRDLRSEELLGQGATDKDGRYKIEYTAHAGKRQEIGTVDLVVKVLDAKDQVVVESPVRFNAEDRTTIDLIIDSEAHREPSLFERIGTAIHPLLNGMAAAELEENAKHQDITFLSGESGFAFADLLNYGLAHRMGTRTLPAEFWFALHHERAMVEEGGDMKVRLEAFQNTLRTFSTPDVRSAMEKAFLGNVISVELRERAAAWSEAFASFVLDLRIKQRSPDDVAVLALLEAGIASAPKRRKVLAQLQAHGGLTAELLAELRKQKTLSTKELDNVRTVYTLYELTGQDARVSGALRSTHKLKTPDRIRDLAKKSPSEWRAWVKTNAKAGSITIPFATDAEARLAKLPAADLFASELERTFREAFPTAAFTGGLERAPRATSTTAFGDPSKLAGFLNAHEDFDLLRSPVDEYFSKHVEDVAVRVCETISDIRFELLRPRLVPEDAGIRHPQRRPVGGFDL